LESIQSPPSEGIASAVAKNAQLSARGANKAAGIGSGGGEALPEQQIPEHGQHENGPHGGIRPSVRAKAFNCRSVNPRVVRDVTSEPYAATVDDGANTPHVNQAISP
jgi:hypothetical protein